jgi:hypothetical protein
MAPLAPRLNRLLHCGWFAALPLLPGCQPPPIQKQFKRVERWGSRWCADASHERLDSCKMSDGLNKLYGSVGALRDGDGLPPLRIDRTVATQACLDGDTEAISNLNVLLSEGAKVVVRGEKMHHFIARTSPRQGEKDYHLVYCHYRVMILEGPERLLTRR